MLVISVRIFATIWIAIDGSQIEMCAKRHFPHPDAMKKVYSEINSTEKKLAFLYEIC